MSKLARDDVSMLLIIALSLLILVISYRISVIDDRVDNLQAQVDTLITQQQDVFTSYDGMRETQLTLMELYRTQDINDWR